MGRMGYLSIYLYLYIRPEQNIFCSFTTPQAFWQPGALLDTVQSIKTFLKINHIPKFTAKAMLKISIQAKIIINETILLEQNAP